MANDYRQVGIVRDVLNSDTTLATDETRIATKSLNLIGTAIGIGGQFQPDEEIIGNDGVNPDATAKIVSFTDTGGNTGVIAFWQDSETGFEDFFDGMTITGTVTGSTGTIDASGVIPAEVLKNSGQIIYIEHRRPVLRAPDQIEDIKVILEF